jgi:cytochrome c-type biogenesis protein CcmH
MTLLLIFAAMTAAAVGAVIWPLTRKRDRDRSGSDVLVYRDQLDEVERDLATGLIGKNEAEAARVEISRRLIAAEESSRTTLAVSSPASGRRQRAAAAVALLALPVLAGGLYLWLGSPQLASAQQERAPQAAQANESVQGLISQVETYLQRNPQDGRGWEIVAPVYMQLSRYSDAVRAWRNALQLLGENAERDANLGESLTAEANGVVTAEAKAAFVRAADLDNTLVTARYYLGLAAEQDSDRTKAAKIWRDLIAEAPAGAEWVPEVRNALARVDGSSGVPPAAAERPIAAAPNAPNEQESAMIKGMVERLAARLKQDGADAEGWARLVRSYRVLDEPDNALAAMADARQALAADPAKLETFNRSVEQEQNTSAPTNGPNPTSRSSVAAQEASPVHAGAGALDMVDRLAARLKTNGSDPGGWLMLVRSYLTLSQKDKAIAAIDTARHALTDNPTKLEEFNEALKRFDISD